MFKRTLIISRYNEDINWLSDITSWNIIIFNKGAPVDTNLPSVCLQNVGREAETYLNYIVANYDNLNDYTGFLQGRPFDHFEGHPENTNTVIEHINTIETTQDFLFFGTQDLHECDHGGHPHHPGLDLLGYANLIKINIPATIRFRAGAQFIVSRERILKKPKSFYCDILETVNKETSPREAYLLERLWQYVFE